MKKPNAGPARARLRRSGSPRVSRRPDAGGWRALNGLEVDLLSIVFRDATGAAFAADPLDGGEEVRLEPADEAQVKAALDSLNLGLDLGPAMDHVPQTIPNAQMGSTGRAFKSFFDDLSRRLTAPR